MPTALIFSHYTYPDDLVSAVHVGGLAEGLAKRGWQVTVMPCNRGRHNESETYPPQDTWQGVHIKRVWRPNVRQASSIGRIFNAVWMILRWSLAALSSKNAPDVLIIGTDPILSIFVARSWRLMRPKTRIVHWCFDLFPEAAIADGLLRERGVVHRLILSQLPTAYRCCQLIIDIGPCMRKKLLPYSSQAKSATLTPWALVEPDQPLPTDAEERQRLFGAVDLALMYSGNFGRAHSYEEILTLVRALREYNIKLVFSVRGSCERELRAAVKTTDTNISFCDFAAPDRLEQRLSASDIQVVSLHPDWTGIVVPSKFFGAIAAGRPVLFAGSPECAVAKWIESYRLGWVLTSERIGQVAQGLINYMTTSGERSRMRQHCYDVYHKYFERDKILDGYDRELRQLLKSSTNCEGSLDLRDTASSLEGDSV